MEQHDSTQKDLQRVNSQLNSFDTCSSNEERESRQPLNTCSLVLEEDFVKEETILCSDEESMEIKVEDEEIVRAKNSCSKENANDKKGIQGEGCRKNNQYLEDAEKKG